MSTRRKRKRDMRTLQGEECVYCTYCGRKLIEVYKSGRTYSEIRCPKWGTGFWRLDFEHDTFIGTIKRVLYYDSITGEALHNA